MWGILGLLIPAAFLLHWKLTDSPFGELEAILWPSSILSMGLEGPTPRSTLDIAEVFAVLIAENVLLYSLVGLLTCPFAFLFFRWRRRSLID